MISLSMARQLKDAGLTWIPAMHDYFAVPDRGLDDHIFVINDIMAYVEIRNNLPMVTFHGSAEWALDYLLTSDVIWLPKEDQLRMTVMRLLSTEQGPALLLASTGDGYRLEIQQQGDRFAFEAPEASEAYAAALLYLLESQSTNRL
jgi:hypothetical protein